MKLPEHLLASSTDGHLYDTRKVGWANNPIRRNYICAPNGLYSKARHVAAEIRNGAYAWPGGYPKFFVTQDGEALCYKCARKEFRRVAWDFLNNASTGWRIEAVAVNWEGRDLYCDNCSEQIESAYE